MLAAGVAGGVGASYLGPKPVTRSQTPDNGAEGRIAALEDRIPRLPAAAPGLDEATVADLRADIEGLNVRLRALEAAEAAAPAPTATPEAADRRRAAFPRPRPLRPAT